MSKETTRQECSVRVGPLVNIPTLLLELDCEPSSIFEKNEFELNEFETTEHRVPYVKASRLLADCVAETGCEYFGLRLGQMAGPSYLGIAGFLARTASSVGQALEKLVENLSLHDEGGHSALHIENDFCQLSFHIHTPGVSATAQIYDMSTVIMCEIMRALCGKDWNASQVLLARKKPTDLSPYTRYFRTDIRFDSEGSGILFPGHNLQLKPPMADELLHHHLELEASALHKMQNKEILETLPTVLQNCLLRGGCSVRDIADAFGIHERTLHRRLKASGTSFRHELDRARECLSTQLLKSSGLPICDIATSLAYADSSGFIRAFHRWTGSSPAVWRKQKGRMQTPEF